MGNVKKFFRRIRKIIPCIPKPRQDLQSQIKKQWKCITKMVQNLGEDPTREKQMELKREIIFARNLQRKLDIQEGTPVLELLVMEKELSLAPKEFIFESRKKSTKKNLTVTFKNPETDERKDDEIAKIVKDMLPGPNEKPKKSDLNGESYEEPVVPKMKVFVKHPTEKDTPQKECKEIVPNICKEVVPNSVATCLNMCREVSNSMAKYLDNIAVLGGLLIIHFILLYMVVCKGYLVLFG